MAILGCIADDFTGASDAASFLVKGGMTVQLYNGVPDGKNPLPPSQAIVIALKSRTQETRAAVADSVAAAQFLIGQGVQQIYFKYCSTFDSTPKGNIGPVCDALMELTHSPYSVLCPSLPVNGRTVKDGRLFVLGVPLDESPMKAHPLTPMWDSQIANLMRPQSRYECRIITSDQFENNIDISSCNSEEPYYLIPDYVTDKDGITIVQKWGHLPLLTGGSGLLEPLAQMWSRDLGYSGSIPDSHTAGNAIIIAGSCSVATRGQITWYQEQHLPSIRMNPISLWNGTQTIDDIWDYVLANTTPDTTVLVYSSDTPEMVRQAQSIGSHNIATLLENNSAELARRAVASGFTRIISAGGETSGAISKGLGFSSYYVGDSVAPGVPVLTPTNNPQIRLILKSGNFGQLDFFGQALQKTCMQ